VANDHFVPRVLTTPWEFKDRRVRLFDFATRAFTTVPTKKLFAKEGLNSERLEKWFDRTIETPLGAFVSPIREGAPFPDPARWEARRALALLMILSASRIGEGRWGDGGPVTMESLTSGEGAADRIAQYFFGRFKLFCARVPDDRQLFFTEAVQFAYPLPDTPVAVIPLGLNHVAMAYDGPLEPNVLLKNINLSVLAGFSLGIGNDVHRVVLPPGFREASFEDEAGTRSALLELRQSLREMFDLIGRASVTSGLRGVSHLRVPCQANTGYRHPERHAGHHLYDVSSSSDTAQ
jgi:hypothetical protein